MRRRTILLALLLFSVASLPAQESKITGKVCDNENNPIDYATVIIQSPDSAYTAAAVTDSLGAFKFDKVLPSYKLIIQHLLYQTKEVVLTSKAVEPLIIRLLPKDHSLKQVVVTAKRPLVKVVDGKLTYDIEQITRNKAVSNAYEALLQLPGVREQSGNISLTGTENVTIILNGKASTMDISQIAELLKQMPASQIESAEVMYSAPPQYHVRGAAINVVTRKIKSGSGESVFQGEINGAYSQRHYASYTTGASLLYSTEKLSAGLLYSFSGQKGKSGMNLFSRHNLNSVIHNISQFNNGGAEAKLHTGRLTLDYRLNDKNQISFAYNAFVQAKGKAKELSTGDFSESSNLNDYRKQMHNISIDYVSGTDWKAGVNYTYFKNPSTQYFGSTNNSDPKNGFISDAQQEINSMMLYADGAHNIKKDWKLTYGAKFNYTKDHDYQLYRDVQGNISVSNTNNTIKEYICDGYIGIGKDISKRLSMSLSVTGEYYKLAQDAEWSVFPQAELTYMPSAKHLFQFSISSDKQYPTYWEKQEYKGFLNGYAEIWGNPSLKPYNNYSAQLAYIHNRKYIACLYYIYQPDYAVQLAYQAPDRLSLVYQTLNWDYNQKLGINIVVPFEVGNQLSSQLTLNAFYHKAKNREFYDISFERHKFISYVSLENVFNLSSKPDLKLEASAYYMTKPMQGIYDMSDLYNVDAGIKWTFAGKRAELRFKASDIFNSSTPDMHVRKSGQDYDMYMKADNRNMQISFSYKFGGYKNQARKKIDQSRFGH